MATTDMPADRERVFRILLVEDNTDDVVFFRRAIASFPHRVEVEVFDDGERALERLRLAGAYANLPRPDLVLLDLNLPTRDGLEVLEAVKAGPPLCRMPVVVFTTSSARVDIVRALDAHANAYLTKPADLHQFQEMVHSLLRFWISAAPPAA